MTIKGAQLLRSLVIVQSESEGETTIGNSNQLEYQQITNSLCSLESNNMSQLLSIGLVVVLLALVGQLCRSEWKGEALRCGTNGGQSFELGTAVLANPGQLPILVRIIDIEDELYRCDGVIISNEHILTAPECIRPKLSVIAGGYPSGSSDGQVLVRIVEDSQLIRAKFARITAAKPFKFELRPEGYGSINRVCGSTGVPQLGQSVIVAGWGPIEGESEPDEPHYTRTKLIECPGPNATTTELLCPESNQGGRPGSPILRVNGGGQLELVDIIG